MPHAPSSVRGTGRLFEKSLRVESHYVPQPAAETIAGDAVGTAVRCALLAAAFGLCLIGMCRIAAIDVETLAGEVLIDDAFYYVVPARHLLEGKGYSFDGRVRTNGVQPLWAAVCVGLAAAFPDNDGVLYAMFFLSGLLWLAAGAVVYFAIRRHDPWLATLAAVGWTFVGIHSRIALTGMENGLHALFCAALLACGVSYLHPFNGAASRFDRPKSYFVLGLLLSGLALTRVDSALLMPILGLLVWIGLIRPGRSGRFRWNWSGAFWLTLPCVVCVGGMMAFSWLYFGLPLPVSGQVKLFLENNRPLPHGSLTGELLWHGNFLLQMAMLPDRWLRITLGILAGLGAACWLCDLWRARRQQPWRLTAHGWFLVAWLAFVACRLLTYAWKLPHFTAYGKWYFAPELLTLWCLCCAAIVRFAHALHATARRWRSPLKRDGLLPTIACGAIIVAAFPALWTPRTLGSRCHPNMKAGKWLAAHAPAGQRIGSFSSGRLSYFAAPHQVINLDGLMNDKHYFQQYMRPRRIPAYFRQQQCDYFADHASAADWRKRRLWGIDLSHMQLLLWRPMANGQSFSLFRVLSDDRATDVLDPCGSEGDRISQIQCAAAVWQRFPVVDEQAWKPQDVAAASSLPRPARLFCSFVDPQTMRLQHVFVPPDQIAGLGVTRQNVDISTPLQATFGDQLELLGYDISPAAIRRGTRFFVTRFWTLRERSSAAEKLPADASIELWLCRQQSGNSPSGKLQRMCHTTRPCYGTHPLDCWKPGEVVVETYGVVAPGNLPRGKYAVVLRVVSARRCLPVTGPSALSTPPGVFLMNLDVQ